MELDFDLKNENNKSNLYLENFDHEDFIEQNFDFLYFGPSQASIKMIDTLINTDSVPTDAGKHQLRMLILQTYQDLALNEIEVVYWSIIIENYVWTESCTELRLSLAFTALFTKEVLGQNIEYQLNKYSQKEELFREKYTCWILGKNIKEITVFELNKQYNKLISKENKINYNYYVDEIILQYLPYAHTKSKNSKKLLLPPVNSLNHKGRIIRPIASTGLLNQDLLPLLPLEKASSSSNSKNSIPLNNQGSSGASQYLCFDI
jgi:hypothetical protein